MRNPNPLTALRACFLLFLLVSGAGSAQPAEPSSSERIQTALSACAAMQERFAGTQCTALATNSGEYRITIEADTPDAMRVVFMRSLDVADGLCVAGSKVALLQQLQTSGGQRLVRWKIEPPDCAIRREE